MNLAVVSPEYDHPHEYTVLSELFAAGLERFHLRKPRSSRSELVGYLERIPREWRSQIVLHQHHDLVETFGLGGRHWRDDGTAPTGGRVFSDGATTSAVPGLTSRSCHDLATLRAALGHYDSVFFGPVFPSISKSGYQPSTSQTGEALGAILSARTESERRTTVLAIGGIDEETAVRALALGFDGVVVLGAVWLADNPVGAFRALRSAVSTNSFATSPSRAGAIAGQSPSPGKPVEVA